MEGARSEEVGEGTSSACREVGAGVSPTEASVTLAMTTIIMEDVGHLMMEMRTKNMDLSRCILVQKQVQSKDTH